jgi:alpha-galactosidase
MRPDTTTSTVGYTSLLRPWLTATVDDCWMMKDGRDKDGHLVPNATRFPNGIDGLAEKVHKLGLKFGIYSSE